MFYEEIRTKTNLSYISFCSLSSLYNSKFILMATSLGTNTVVVTRVRCTTKKAENLQGVSSATKFNGFKKEITNRN